MAKPNGNASQESKALATWDDWFFACGDLARKAAAYEGEVARFHDIMEGAGAVASREAFADRHVCRFWEREGLFTGHVRRNAIIGALAGLVAGFAAGLVLSLVRHSMQVEALPLVLFAVLGLCIGFAAGFLPKFLARKGCEKRMGAIEPALAEVMRYTPPKYRNSFCMEAIGDARMSYGVSKFDTVVDALDEHIRKNRSSYPGICIMFDYPMASHGPDGSFADDAPKDGSQGGPDLSAPGLPPDIESHIVEGSANADEELASLIGMESVKDQVRKLKSRVEFYGDAKAAGQGGNHLMFIGSAGTGKTITARIVTKIFYDFGYIRENRMIEVDGEYLKSAYVGQTGERTSAIVQAAKGGVLFIDEAYLLFDEKASSAVGKEATGVLLKAMEDDRDDLVVILAGYEDGMNRLVASNEGFASRIAHKIYFDPYTADELGLIFKKFLNSSAASVHDIEPEGYDMLVEHFEQARNLPGFGNAREARNALDRLLDVHADRCVSGEESASKREVITAGDVAAMLGVERKRLAADGRNFMATSHLDESIISLAELKSRTKDGAGDPESALRFLVGMDDAKEAIHALMDRAAFFRQQGVDAGEINLNMGILGSAGTGKSTIAGIITGFLHKAGYVRDNKYLDITGDFLKASYVGQTGKRTEAAIEYSKGMVLFIDEAYLLDTAGSGHDFGAEALGVLVNAMEKSQGELVVIVAGYPDEMDQMLERNPGMKSRIATTVYLPDYTPRELCAIFKRMAHLRGFSVDKAVYQPMADYAEPLMGTRSFGNARFARQLVDDCVTAHATRHMKGDVEAGREMVIETADLAQAIASRSKGVPRG